MRSIRTILIANRGEIARRIIRTCNRLQIRTVAIYSDADRGAPYVNEATVSHRLKGYESRDTYLNIPRILEIAEEESVDAIHPGYGFLSENANFARSVEEKGIRFIGPGADAISIMGIKVESRKKVISVGVPIVPGYDGEDFKTGAGELGYPVLIKASAGGGGRGMRKVYSEDELFTQLEGAKREALSFFANDSVFLEKLILSPRHIEVQIFGDEYGNTIHLYDRDCSIQRRNQKIIEEAPAPNLSEDVRQKLYEYACRAASSIGYVNAGTVEFVLDESQNIYFLEMNTRLQVEHPVTEAITGLDLVELQIRIAGGESLKDIFPNGTVPMKKGSAIELRVCSEEGFLDSKPGSGRIHLFQYSGDSRLDSGVETGNTISIYYDSMIAKLISFGDTREDALQNSLDNLKKLIILGIPTNLKLLKSILSHDVFQNSKMNTGFIENYITEPDSYSRDTILKFLCLAHLISSIRIHEISTRAFSGLGNDSEDKEKCLVPDSIYLINPSQYLYKKKKYSVRKTESEYLVTEDKGNNNIILPEVKYIYPNRILFVTGESVFFARYGNRIFMQYGEDTLGLEVYTESGNSSGHLSNAITSSMPGKILALHVREGDRIQEGDPLLTIESMKMELVLRSEKNAEVSEILFQVGSQISGEDVLIKLR